MLIFLKFFITLFLFCNFLNGNDHHYVSAQTLPPGFCPSPLIYRNSTNRQSDIDNGYMFIGETNCTSPCPSLIFSENEWNRVFNMSLVAGTISMFALIFLIITYSPLVNNYKGYTRHTVGILFLFSGIFLTVTTDGRQLWDIESGFEKYCPEPGRYARQSDIKCLTTAIFFQYGCVTSILWWAAISVDLWITIRKIKITRFQFITYTVILNIISLVLTFAPIASNQYGYGEAAIGCWLMDLKFQVGYFWAPVGFCLCVGCVSIVLILREIYKVSDAVKKKLLAKHLKPLMLIILMLTEFIYMFIFYSYTTSQRNHYHNVIEEYVTCLFVHAVNPSICKVDVSISSPAHFFFHFCMRLMGIEGLIFFGFTRQTKRIWLRSFWLNNSFIKKLLPSLTLSSDEKTTSSNRTATRGHRDTEYVGESNDDPEHSIELSGIDSKN
ncbi:hypothetical protein RB653_010257 [Dictyostelium firmibasis]|uniref:Uncharacterized protein n=1 Tax=Dictyostelium firmibasis TaxID=79012 RepID=A0AAN7YTI8_9MYCE